MVCLLEYDIKLEDSEMIFGAAGDGGPSLHLNNNMKVLMIFVKVSHKTSFSGSLSLLSSNEYLGLIIQNRKNIKPSLIIPLQPQWTGLTSLREH